MNDEMMNDDIRVAASRDLDTLVGAWKDMMVALYGCPRPHEVSPRNEKERA